MTLSRERVVDTAVAVLSRYGLADLSMRRLARELGVQPGALYWHVASKQELLVEVADRLLRQRVAAPQSQDPAAAVRALAVAIRAALLRVPDSADVVALAYAVDPGSVEPLRELSRLLRRLGVAGARLDAATQLLVHHILGSVTAEQNRRQASASDPGPVADAGPGALAAFELGLDVILDGLRPPP
ncbi:MAG TPA: TetR family transcriptional regulator [Intrasporangium sp.]|uniref:TetR family transcriptional regulator n=1 Tax=Intrasporangium sp. TaxID=1925024 RepID=UPI002D769AE1|nr:TetR family transcriptional regulator [Intrasporangium sp.]HET7399221.1 TetR family transcriptional regulator [Intrasporangium sp.]